jgi:hypothetical protein
MARRREPYAARIKRLTEKGYTRSQARGHPVPGEHYVSSRAPPRATLNAKLEAALKRLRRPGTTLSGVAADAHVSRELLSRYMKGVAGARWEGRKWTFDDRRIRRLEIIAAEQFQPVTIRVRGFEPAHIAGLHAYEAGQALRDQKLVPEFVSRWKGHRIKDAHGRWHTLSTDMNQLYAARLMNDYSFEQYYRIEI